VGIDLEFAAAGMAPILFFLGIGRYWVCRSVRKHPLSAGVRAAIEADLETLDDGLVRRELMLRLWAEDDPRRARRTARLYFAAAFVCLALPCLLR